MKWCSHCADRLDTVVNALHVFQSCVPHTCALVGVCVLQASTTGESLALASRGSQLSRAGSRGRRSPAQQLPPSRPPSGGVTAPPRCCIPPCLPLLQRCAPQGCSSDVVHNRIAHAGLRQLRRRSMRTSLQSCQRTSRLRCHSVRCDVPGRRKFLQYPSTSKHLRVHLQNLTLKRT